MSARAIESRIAPRNLTLADIVVPKNEFNFGSFGPNSSSYEDALACLRMYRKQVTQLNYDQRCEIVRIITEGHFFRTRTAMKAPFGHKYYRYARQSDFAAERLSWPEYIIMHTLYNDDLPPTYVSHIRQTFGTAAIEDFSYQFFELFPEMNDNSKDENPEEATKQPTSTSAASNAGALEVTPAIGLNARDILDRLPSKTSEQSFKRIDKASRDRLQYLLRVIRETTILNNIRLGTLEESHRDLETKLGAMTIAFDTMNTTIETIVTEARADREGHNHVLGSIKDVMMGMADSIKDIKEQL
ncbi:hypothetical protein MKX08_008628 [Trichoderma sp. CBMAI-0020]|nr:hypothetical protein MKX08_008628 [Trichoderma sp. CBMAI-0020]